MLTGQRVFAAFYKNYVLVYLNCNLDWTLLESILINHSLSSEMNLNKPSVNCFNCEKGLRQEGHPAVKHCCKLERIYVMSNIADRNKGTEISCEGVINSRKDFGVGTGR